MLLGKRLRQIFTSKKEFKKDPANAMRLDMYIVYAAEDMIDEEANTSMSCQPVEVNCESHRDLDESCDSLRHKIRGPSLVLYHLEPHPSLPCRSILGRRSTFPLPLRMNMSEQARRPLLLGDVGPPVDRVLMTVTLPKHGGYEALIEACHARYVFRDSMFPSGHFPGLTGTDLPSNGLNKTASGS